jgi:hypothetical protein
MPLADRLLGQHLGLAVVLTACATGGDQFAEPIDTAAGGTGGVGASAGGAGGAGGTSNQLLPSSCPAGELALGVDSAGKLVCDQPGAQPVGALAAGCRLAFGWRDGCATSCVSPPAKWAIVDSASCEVSGADSTCNTLSLGGKNVELAAVNTDGDVDNNDRFYFHFSCEAVEDPASHIGPCTPGEWVNGVAPNGAVTCAPLAPFVANWAHGACRAHFGWRDGCSGCTSAPAKWGSIGALSCGDGLDPSNLCFDAALGATTLEMYTLVTGGDVDDNDTFYFGLGCDPPSTAVSTAQETCPEGQFVRSIEADGTLTCAPPDVFAAEAMKACTLYAGWRDGCAACNLVPSKWGRARIDGCINDVGTHNVCINAELGGQSVQLFGLNTDGDVDGNDSFFVGFRCEE